MLAGQILETWKIHNDINLFLIQKIPAKGFAAVPSGSKGRTVARQLSHMNRVRLGWLFFHETGKRPDLGVAKKSDPSRAELKKAFADSGKKVAAFIEKSAERGNRSANVQKEHRALDGIFDCARIAPPRPDYARFEAKRNAPAGKRFHPGVVGKVDVWKMKDITKKYTNGEVTIVWKPAICEHSAVCFLGLPGVFNPTKRPWINVQGRRRSASWSR